jgi:hypothetical protein
MYEHILSLTSNQVLGIQFNANTLDIILFEDALRI